MAAPAIFISFRSVSTGSGSGACFIFLILSRMRGIMLSGIRGIYGSFLTG